MHTIAKISKYYLYGEFKASIIVLGIILVLHLVLAVLVNMMGNSGFSGIIDVVAPVSMISLGISMFLPSFRYLMSQNLSRTTFFAATVTGIALVAAVYSLLITVYMAIVSQFGNNTVGFNTMYESRSIPGLFLWEFSYLFMLGMLGWCVRIIEYVTGRVVSIILVIVLLVLLTFVVYLNAINGGAVFDELFTFLTRILGVHGGVPNPYIAVGSFMAMSLIWGGIIFAFTRRAQVKD